MSKAPPLELNPATEYFCIQKNECKLLSTLWQWHDDPCPI